MRVQVLIEMDDGAGNTSASSTKKSSSHGSAPDCRQAWIEHRPWLASSQGRAAEFDRWLTSVRGEKRLEVDVTRARPDDIRTVLDALDAAERRNENGSCWERDEALERAWAEYRDAAPENNTPDQRRAFFAALRRPVSPEPSYLDEQNDRREEVHPEPQTEPTDALLGVMAQRFYEASGLSIPHTSKPEVVAGLRAALRAAFSVQGENR